VGRGLGFRVVEGEPLGLGGRGQVSQQVAPELAALISILYS